MEFHDPGLPSLTRPTVFAVSPARSPGQLAPPVARSRWWGTARPPGTCSNLEYACRSDHKNQGRAEHNGEQEGDRERQACVHAVEVNLDPLKIQQDEDQQQHQEDQRRCQDLPRGAQPGPPGAQRVRPFRPLAHGIPGTCRARAGRRAGGRDRGLRRTGGIVWWLVRRHEATLPKQDGPGH
jgi:hypothetical protein